MNEQLAPFRVLRGTECDIRRDGTLDLPDDVLAELDWVQLSLHAGQREDADRLTRKVVEAMRHPAVRCLSHPKGRIINHRPPNALELERVIEVALEEGVALETNGLPDRLDLRDEEVRLVVEAGVPIVCSTDAHSVRGLGNMQLAVATARRGWATAADVLNTRGLDEVLGLRPLLRRYSAHADTFARGAFPGPPGTSSATSRSACRTRRGRRRGRDRRERSRCRLELLPALRLVANFGVGYDRLDRRSVPARGVAVTNTPGVLDAATADLAFALMLADAAAGRRGRRPRPFRPLGDAVVGGAVPRPRGDGFDTRHRRARAHRRRGRAARARLRHAGRVHRRTRTRRPG